MLVPAADSHRRRPSLTSATTDDRASPLTGATQHGEKAPSTKLTLDKRFLDFGGGTAHHDPSASGVAT